jgi:hypothetical protein
MAAATSNRALCDSLSQLPRVNGKEQQPPIHRGRIRKQRNRQTEQAIAPFLSISSPFLCHSISFVIPFIFQG